MSEILLNFNQIDSRDLLALELYAKSGISGVPLTGGTVSGPMDISVGANIVGLSIEGELYLSGSGAYVDSRAGKISLGSGMQAASEENTRIKSINPVVDISSNSGSSKILFASRGGDVEASLSVAGFSISSGSNAPSKSNGSISVITGSGVSISLSQDRVFFSSPVRLMDKVEISQISISKTGQGEESFVIGSLAENQGAIYEISSFFESGLMANTRIGESSPVKSTDFGVDRKIKFETVFCPDVVRSAKEGAIRSSLTFYAESGSNDIVMTVSGAAEIKGLKTKFFEMSVPTIQVVTVTGAGYSVVNGTYLQGDYDKESDSHIWDHVTSPLKIVFKENIWRFEQFDGGGILFSSPYFSANTLEKKPWLATDWTQYDFFGAAPYPTVSYSGTMQP